MAKKIDATFENILGTIKNAKDNVIEARIRAKEAMEAAEDAGHVLKQAFEFIKIRREEE